MTMSVADFTSRVKTEASIHRWYTNKLAEANAIVAALGTDTTKRDTTLQTAPIALRPGAVVHSAFTNDMLLDINAGKAGSLTVAQMAGAINGILSAFSPPVNTVAPVVSGVAAVGETLSCTTGTWSYSPTSYSYQWFRDSAIIDGATSADYVTVAVDSGTSIMCGVTARNTAGTSNGALSNAIAVA